jgi:hypothetical protein
MGSSAVLSCSPSHVRPNNFRSPTCNDTSGRLVNVVDVIDEDSHWENFPGLVSMTQMTEQFMLYRFLFLRPYL